MATKTVTASVFAAKKAELVARITAALVQELADCELPGLADDPTSGSLWASLPTVDSKTACKISASIVEEMLGCQFKPTWIRRGGYDSTGEAAAHVVDQLQTNCVEAAVAVAA